MPERHTAQTVLMVRPKHFGFNQETAGTNLFQHRPADLKPEEITRRAVQEFDGLRDLLIRNEVSVLTFDDADSPVMPDSLFPNNWITTHGDGTLVLYPMEGTNRRLERRPDIVTYLRKEFGFSRVIDLSAGETEGRFLEGTGSMVFDRANSAVYACKSSRTDASLLQDLTERLHIPNVYAFGASAAFGADAPEAQIYHTNVMMAVGDTAAVVCPDVIRSADKDIVLVSLVAGGRNLIEISAEQMFDFAGNMLQLRNQRDELLWIMSTRAFDSLTDRQRVELEKGGARLCHVPLDIIEYVGGGSARCMLTEIFPPVRG